MFLRRLPHDERRPPTGGCDGLNIDMNEDDDDGELLLPNPDDVQLVGNVIHVLEDDGDDDAADDGEETADESNDDTRALAAAAELEAAAACCCVVAEADCANACNNAWYGIKLLPDFGDPDDEPEDAVNTGNEDKNDDKSLV